MRQGEEWKNILEELPVGAAILRGGHGLYFDQINHFFFDDLHYDREELKRQGHQFHDYVYGEDMGTFEEMIEATAGGRPATAMVRVIGADKAVHWHRQCVKLCGYQDAVPYYILISVNIDKAIEMEEELSSLDERNRLLEEVTEEVPLEYDVKRNLFRVPQKYYMSGKVKDSDKKYMTFDEVLEDIFDEDKNKFTSFIRSAAANEMSGVIDYRLNVAAPESEPRYFWHRTVYRSVRGRDGDMARIVGRNYDINADRQLQEKLAREVQLDPLTRVYNKVAMDRMVSEFLETKPDGMHALLLIDIDDFKNINDSFGHTVGDTVIVDMAEAIKNQLTLANETSEVIVGRVGGDEFLAFVKDTSEEEIARQAEALCKGVKKNLAGDGAVVELTLSMGIAIYGVDGEGYKFLYDMADRAMYHTKRNGKNGYSFACQSDEAGYGELKTSRGIDREYQNKSVADKEFLNVAYSLLSHAKDINGSLNVLLERIGRNYALDFVAVFDMDTYETDRYPTNLWSSFGPVSGVTWMPYLPERFIGAQVGQFMETTIERDAIDKVYLENWSGGPEPLRHLAGVKFEYGSNRIGMFLVGNRKVKRKFSLRMMSTVCELARAVGVFVSLRNQIMQDQKEIKELQSQDKLTGILNIEAFRKKTMDVLREARETGNQKQFALTYMDINNFSYINENFGQRMGDGILKDFAVQLLERANTVAACRMYSDYFIVLECGADRADMIAATNRGNHSFELSLNRKYPAGTLRLSTGMYFIGAEGEGFDSILESANMARKLAKQNKMSDVCIYEEEMRRRRDIETQITGMFYAAMEKGEIEMFLQPKFLLKEKKLYGAEALARWRLPSGELMPPYRFIPPLENVGYILDLDFYIFEQLLKSMMRWQSLGKKLFAISTNFSRKHFADGGIKFLERLSAILSRYEVEPGYIEIEVTESVISEDIEKLKVCLQKVADMGFRIAIDDFGTGYSSLGVLMDIPANVVKIDKKFTDRIIVDGQQGFVSSMGQFIQTTKNEIIFEGIEEEAQCRFLIDRGFNYGQGYLFDKPIPVEEFERKYL